MITFGNKYLTVELLDPVNDRGKTGSRYCTGCYIWQIYDKNGRTLLSGPKYPDADPPVFDGQGMPEVFEEPLGGGSGGVGSDVCVIGVGLVRRSSDIEPFHPRDNPEVVKPCAWDVEAGDDYAVMAADQSFNGRSIQLRREARVDKNTVISATAITNTGGEDITLRWFAHPFFPLNDGLACGKIEPKVSLPESAGYMVDSDGIIRMRREYPWQKGLFQPLDVPPERLSFTIPHPTVKVVTARADYPVSKCPVWANDRTFSFEPFLCRAVKKGGCASWGIAYTFGA